MSYAKMDIISLLKTHQQNNQGELLNINEQEAIYLDYALDTEVQYKFNDACSDGNLSKMIHIGSNASQHGLTKEHIINVLKRAFGDEYFDAVRTLQGILIPSDETEFYQMLNDANRTSDNMREWYEWEEYEELVGSMLSHHQMILINNELIMNVAAMIKEISTLNAYEIEYQIGIITTLIHEMRHLMLDTNKVLTVNESEGEEEAVETFCRNRFENLGDLKLWRK